MSVIWRKGFYEIDHPEIDGGDAWDCNSPRGRESSQRSIVKQQMFEPQRISSLSHSQMLTTMQSLEKFNFGVLRHNILCFAENSIDGNYGDVVLR